MKFPEGKYAWMVKIGEKGQFVIPKEAREIFDIKPGDTVLVLADRERGVAIPPKEMRDKCFAMIFQEMEDLEQKREQAEEQNEKQCAAQEKGGDL